MGRGGRHVRLPPTRRASVGRCAGGVERLLLHLERLRLRGLQHACERGQSGRRARRPARRRGDERELRPAEGAVRERRSRRVRRASARRSPGPHRRAARPHGSLHLLAASSRARRTGARAGPARTSHAGDRRARPRRVDDRALRTAQGRHVQRHPSRSCVLGAPRDLSRRHFERRTTDVGHGSSSSSSTASASGWSFRSGSPTRRSQPRIASTSGGRSARGSRSERWRRRSAPPWPTPRRSTASG